MPNFVDLSGNGQGAQIAGRLDFDNVTTKTIAAVPGQRVLITDLLLTLDAAGTISITDGTTPMKFKCTAADKIAIGRINRSNEFVYAGAAGASCVISATAGNLSGFVEYKQM